MSSMPAAFTPPTLAIPVYTWKIPPKARAWTTDPSTIKIRSFTVAQELDAAKAADVGGGRFEYELFQRAVIEVDGKPVDQGVDLIEKCSPKVRVFIVAALNKMSMPTKEEIETFLESMEVEVS